MLNIARNPNEGVFQNVIKLEIQRAANATNQSQRIRQFFTQQKPKNEKEKKTIELDKKMCIVHTHTIRKYRSKLIFPFILFITPLFDGLSTSHWIASFLFQFALTSYSFRLLFCVLMHACVSVLLCIFFVFRRILRSYSSHGSHS